ncbi:MAG: M56 family metallopeptidase [Vulcanimicrobiaceae bacterium]
MTQLVALLVANLWEAAVIALAAWLVLRIARNANATTRYTVWTASLLLAVALPIVTVCFAGGATSSAGSAEPARIATSAPTRPPHRTSASLRVADTTPALVTPAVQRQPSISVPSRLHLRLSPGVAWIVVGIWAIATLYNLIGFAIAFLSLERLKRNATPLAIEYRGSLHRWNTLAAMPRSIRLCVSAEINVPLAVGIFDAVIVLPSALLERLHVEDVDRILVHELAHLRRHDDWINAFEHLTKAIFFFNPAIAFIAAQMDLEREISCDDSVLERGADALPYATCLAKMVEIVAWPHRVLPAPGVFDTRRNLSIRIERLLTSARDSRTRIAAVPVAIAISVMVALGIAGAAVSPNFAYALPLAKPSPSLAHVTHQTPVRRVMLVHTPAPVRTAAPRSAALPRPAALPRREKAVSALATSRPLATPRPLATLRPVVTPKPRPKTSSSSGGDYIDQLTNAGYRGLSVDQLIQLRALGVDAQYIEQLQAAGYAHPSPRELIRLRAGNVLPEYIAAMRTRLGSLTLNQAAQLGVLGVSPEYVDGLAAAGYKALSAEQLAKLHAVGITPEYIGELGSAGYTGLATSRLIQLRALNVDGAFVRDAAAHGFQHLPVEQLIKLKASGIL